ITDRDQVIVKVNSIDLELVKRNRDRLASLIDGVKGFSIVEDTQVDAGGCIVETNLGYIDARIATKLETVEAAFMKVHKADRLADGEDEEGDTR
ncbi:FliH/SctL family protein, partial [Candidatus Margulisiibacteriota bacterium]